MAYAVASDGCSFGCCAAFGSTRVLEGLGILFAARAPGISVLFIVPLVWSVVGGSAAFLLGVRQDLGLIVSAIVAAALLRAGWHKARSGL